MPDAALVRTELMREFLEYSARNLTQEISYQGYLEQALFHALGALDDDQRTAVLDLMRCDNVKQYSGDIGLLHISSVIQDA